MSVTRYPFRGESDMPRILPLIQSQPLSCRHVLDFPWRLSAPELQEGRDAACWVDGAGQVAGFAAWQRSWAVLDFFLAPGAEHRDVATALFNWADERFRQLDEERGHFLPYWVEFRASDRERRGLVEAHGFVHEEYESYVLLQHALVNLPPVPALPAGFVLRPLASEQEAAAYVELHRAAFGSTSMTPEWRARAIRGPLHRPELDLVITAPDGSLAGFCVGWFVPERRLAQVEPIGVHPRFQRLGLARVLLLEMLSRFKEHGADLAFVETDLDRIPARHAYAAVGFEQIDSIIRKGRWVNRPE